MDIGLDSLRYPIGHADCNALPESRAASIEVIRQLPQTFAAALQGLSPEQLQTPYRPGGWTLQQLAHHVAHSHINAWVRFKRALTEDWPVISPYEEDLWVRTPEVANPIAQPLALLIPLHALWTTALESIPEADWTARGYKHPVNGPTPLAQMLALYDWHSRHHTAHAVNLRARMGW